MSKFKTKDQKEKEDSVWIANMIRSVAEKGRLRQIELSKKCCCDHFEVPLENSEGPFLDQDNRLNLKGLLVNPEEFFSSCQSSLLKSEE